MSAGHVMRNVLPPIVPMVVVTFAAEIAVRQAWLPAFLVPAPSSVIASMFRDAPELWRATFDTAIAALVGFGMSAILGGLIAIALSSAPWVQRAFYPYAVFFQTVPIIAIAPLLVIWFGWNRTVVASAFIVSIFPVIANTLTGLLSTDLPLRDLFQLYNANRVATLFKLRLPFALPHILTGRGSPPVLPSSAPSSVNSSPAAASAAPSWFRANRIGSTKSLPACSWRRFWAFCCSCSSISSAGSRCDVGTSPKPAANGASCNSAHQEGNR